MKQAKNIVWILMYVLGVQLTTAAAQSPAKENAVEMAGISPYRIKVTFDKTSHLIFPRAIRYVDLGSDYLVAGNAENADNVLRVKAAIREFTAETNFSVITDDGNFYNFNVAYSDSPTTLNYDIRMLSEKTVPKETSEVQLEELGFDSPYLAAAVMETIYRVNERKVRHIGTRDEGIRFLLKGIYIRNGKYYFHTELTNMTYVPFAIDFISFKIVDKKVVKRTVIQENPLSPLRMFRPLGTVGGKSTERNIFMLEQFTLNNGKVLLISIHEKNGGRHQTIRIGNSDLIHARPTEKLEEYTPNK